MRTNESPYILDWVAITIRWLFLLGVTITLTLGRRLLDLPNILLVGLVCWNIGLTLLTGLNRRLIYQREISSAIDILFAAAFFAFTGGFTSPAFWIIFLPLMTCPLYFELIGALIAAILITAVQVAVSVFQTPDLVALIILGISLLFTFGVAGLFWYVSVHLGRTIRNDNQGLKVARQGVQQRKLNLENERLRAVYSLTSTLLTTLNYQRVLESVLDLSLSALNTEAEASADDRLVCAVLLFSKDETLEVGSARRFTPADMRVVLRGRQGTISQTIDQDKPVLLSDVRNDPELTRFVAFQMCREIYCFPLRSGLSAYGVLLFGHPQPGFFTRDRRETLDILGSQAVIAIQNARLYQDVVNERERMIEAQEEARNKLARDLHDGPTQSVSAIAMRVNMAQRILTKDPKAALEELVRIEDLARRTTKEIRHMLFTLRPLVLESQGLEAALKSMADTMKETFSQTRHHYHRCGHPSGA